MRRKGRIEEEEWEREGRREEEGEEEWKKMEKRENRGRRIR